ncbi:phage baseplate assembly protein [Ferrovibrio xuzhouensis]|uniref:Phage baseplate assembly protein n=1 Tax=Ferrovibrio xuzhouensis TaxID=1576914 RepID=A0ABV7VB84_9PROT
MAATASAASSRDRVVLKVDGRDYSGWESVRIARGVDRAAADFTLAVTRQYWPITAGMACEVWIGADRLVTGYVDDVAHSHDSATHRIDVSGRSRTADLIDCGASNRPGQWLGQTAQRIADELAGPFGVPVIVRDGGAPIPDHQLQQGETVMESLHRICAMRSLVPTDDVNGRLILHRPGSGGTAGALVAGQGGNVLKATVKFSQRDRFHTYIVKGQQAGFDIADPNQIAQPTGTATDPNIRSNRVAVIIAESQADADICARRARWEAANRAGRGLDITVTVPGWRQADGRLWTVDQITSYRDDIIGLPATSLLVAETVWTKGPDGTLTEMKLAPPAAYQPQPVVPLNPTLAGFAGLLRDELKRNG